MKKRMAVIFLVLLLIPRGASLGQEVTKVGTTSAKFLSIPVGPRALAMGGAFVSLANDATTLYWNPSGLAQLHQREVFLSHSRWLADISFNYLGLVLPLGDVGTVGLSLTAMTMGDMEITTEEQPEGTGESFSASSFAFGASFARSLTDRFSIGASVKYVTESIWNSRANGFAVDIGTLFVTPFRGIRLGASISNFGQKMQIRGDDLLVQKDIDASIAGNNESVNAYLATDKFDLPLLLRIGISTELMKSEQSRLTLSVDGLHPNDNTENVNVGAELALLKEMVFLRAGYKALLQKDSEEQLTLGGGFHYELFEGTRLKLEYAYEKFEHLDNAQKFSLAIIF